jgi:hypothetical protein
MTLNRAQSSAKIIKIIQGLIAAMYVQDQQTISDQTWMPTPVRGIRPPT